MGTAASRGRGAASDKLKSHKKVHPTSYSKEEFTHDYSAFKKETNTKNHLNQHKKPQTLSNPWTKRVTQQRNSMFLSTARRDRAALAPPCPFRAGAARGQPGRGTGRGGHL